VNGSGTVSNELVFDNPHCGEALREELIDSCHNIYEETFRIISRRSLAFPLLIRR
jgi:hypothetical protein